MAAHELLASGGVDVTVRDIAGHAGVGVGTVYRHFPSRGELVDAVLEDAFEELIALAQDALEEPDAWSGFTRFIEQALDLHARNRGLKDVVETHAHGREGAAAMRDRLRVLIARLVERARAEGTLRADFTPQDIPMLFWSSDRVIELAGDVAPDLWRRQLGFVLNSLRAAAATPLAEPALTAEQLQRVGSS